MKRLVYGGKEPCPECGSTIQTKWFVVLFIPLIPIGKYRTKWCSPNQYLSRKLIKATRWWTKSACPGLYWRLHENASTTRKQSTGTTSFISSKSHTGNSKSASAWRQRVAVRSGKRPKSTDIRKSGI